jgi:uncharacterized protein (DUF302 family)
MKYYIETSRDTDYETAVQKVKEALQTEGFGILSEIDIHEKLKGKLDVDFKRYKILGACNPPKAFEALQLEKNIGLFLPCNVIVQESIDGGVDIAAVDPVASMMSVDNEKLVLLIKEIKEMLIRVIRSI